MENYNYAQNQQTTSDFLYTHLCADCVLLGHEVTLPRYISNFTTLHKYTLVDK